MAKAVRARPWPTRLAVGLAALVVILGLIVLAGWFTHTPALIQLLPHLPPMTRNTAACFLLSGAALLVLALGGPRYLVVLCAAGVSVLSILRAVEIVFRVNLGISEILGPSYINVGLVTRGGMAPGPAICFALGSIALMLTTKPLSTRSAMLLGFVGSTLAAFGLVATIGQWGGIRLAAAHTSVGFLILGTGMLALAWHVESDRATTPHWLPMSVSVAVLAGNLGLWRALILAGHTPFDFLPLALIGTGCLIAPVFGLTVYLAQRGHSQAAALTQSEAFLAEAQRLSSTGSYHWRLATNELVWSEQLHRIFELDKGVPVTLKRIATRFHPEDIPLMHMTLERARRDGSDFESDFRLQMPDKSIKYLHMVAHGTRDKNGQVEYIGAIQDITQRRLSEETLSDLRSELAHVARVTSLGEMAASIAHEVNQPLSGIITNAGTCLRMLAADPPDVAGARETARRTIRDGDRASDIVKRLRALFSKNAAATEALDLNEATREVIALLSSELQRNRVVLRTELGDDVPSVIGDRVQIQQVVMNLLRNALDAMSGLDDRPKLLVVRTAPDEGDRARLTVQDTGVGLDPLTSERVFDAFYSTKTDGMGIGLSVSRSIIERHNGRLWAAANHGPGATFSFTLPCASAAVTLPGGLAAVSTAVAGSQHVARHT